MAKVTVTFKSDEATDQRSARRFVEDLREQARQVGVRDLTFVSYAGPITFDSQEDLDEYVRTRYDENLARAGLRD